MRLHSLLYAKAKAGSFLMAIHELSMIIPRRIWLLLGVILPTLSVSLELLVVGTDLIYEHSLSRVLKRWTDSSSNNNVIALIIPMPGIPVSHLTCWHIPLALLFPLILFAPPATLPLIRLPCPTCYVLPYDQSPYLIALSSTIL
jgi:hypothetical protein